ncbi:Random slug protein [Thalictrum thalictroides]|uniref:Random slug protein n=1 Tax=Thalictrum thalictroides TaxID=46969 RepID=A0A7J6WZU4_THATH|nr:Random slug protein [Thalictrum thalictroides]
MGKKDQKENKEKERVEAVLHLLRKQAPLTVKQEKFCNSACVQRFLIAKGDSVKKATKQLRACLSWRESIGIEYLIADEFSAEISEGVAYVSGYDDESRPVLVFRIKQDYQKFHSQKLYIRLLVFTLEVAIASMARNVDQFVLLFDASFFRSASAFMNLLLASLKVLGEYYPGRTHKAFIIDPPSLFSYLWKGVRPFVELSAITTVVSSLDFEESMEFDDFSSFPRAASLRFDPSSIPSSAKIGPSSSSRFSFQVSHNFDSLKPWYLSLTDTSASKVGPNIVPSPSLMGSALISPINARSYSFASPAARSPRGSINYRCGPPKKTNFFPLTPLPQKVSNMNDFSRTPRPSFLQSPALFFKRSSDCQVSRADKTRESFVPFLRFYRMPYDEMYYRSKMRPPLGGLISIVSSQHQLKRRHASQSQRF